MTGATDSPISIRSFRSDDLRACQRLYVDGLLGGKLAENDTGLDIDDIQTAYFTRPGCHFWVAVDAAGDVVGMVGVQQHEEGVGEIRRLRVRQDHRRRGIGSRLVETAIRFCRDNNHLKITLDTFIDREPAIKLFEKFHFHHGHTRSVGGRDLLYFYMDIYGKERRKP